MSLRRRFLSIAVVVLLLCFPAASCLAGPRRDPTAKIGYLIALGDRDRLIRQVFGKAPADFLGQLVEREQLCVLVGEKGDGARPLGIVYEPKQYRQYLSRNDLMSLPTLFATRTIDTWRAGRIEQFSELARPWNTLSRKDIRDAINAVENKRQRKTKGRAADALLRLLKQRISEWQWLGDARRLTWSTYDLSSHLPPPRRISLKGGGFVIETWPKHPARFFATGSRGWYFVPMTSLAREFVGTSDLHGRVLTIKEGVVVRRKLRTVRRTNKFGVVVEGLESPSPVTTEARRFAAGLYQKFLSAIAKRSGQKVIVPAGIGFLNARDTHTHLLFGTRAPGMLETEKFMATSLRPHYRKHPSDLRVLAALELALVERDLGKVAESRDRLLKAVEHYKLEQIDFRGDATVRKKLSFATPFLRPEVALLFLVAEDARRGGKTEQAAKWYRVLLERAPVSPYAWESLVRLRMLPGVKKTEIGKRQQHLLSFYPCVWGYAEYRTSIPPGQEKPFGGVTPDPFASRYLPGMLDAVEQEVRAVDAWLKQAPNSSARKPGSK